MLGTGTKCSFPTPKTLKKVIKIGWILPKNFLPIPKNVEKIQKFPLSLSVSKESGLIRIIKPFPTSEIKPRFDWLTCFEPEDHLDNLVSEIIKLPGISNNSVFGGFSFKDDTTLNRLAKLGFNKTWRINPEKAMKEERT